MVLPLMVMLPVPGASRTRAIDSLRRPVEIGVWVAMVLVPYAESFSASGFWATCGCWAPAYTLSFLIMARPSALLGIMRFTAFTRMSSGCFWRNIAGGVCLA